MQTLLWTVEAVELVLMEPFNPRLDRSLHSSQELNPHRCVTLSVVVSRWRMRWFSVWCVRTGCMVGWVQHKYTGDSSTPDTDYCGALCWLMSLTHLYFQHLGCVVPECVELQEMICESCMNRNSFLWTYAAHLAGKDSWSSDMFSCSGVHTQLVCLLLCDLRV